jgi:osmotically-inducible protein OsmY
MFRFLLRLIVLAIVLGVIAIVVVGSGWLRPSRDTDVPAGTTGTERARETGAEIVDRVSEGASKAQQALGEAGLTAKIKSKIALDDTLDGTRVGVETNGTIVTLTGEVGTMKQQERVVQLARETTGVTNVVDRIEIRRR